MRTSVKKIAAIVGAMVATASVAPAANAANDGLVQSVISIQNFVLQNAAGVTLDATTDFGAIAVFDRAQVTANLNGVSLSQTVPVASYTPPLDLAQQCIGPGCVFGQNDYTQHTILPTSTYSRSDMQLVGVLINGLPPETPPASSNLLSEVSIIGSGAGLASSLGGTSGSVIFTAANDGIQVRIKFDANSWMIAYVNPALSGQAAQSFNFDLVDQTTGLSVFNWSPNGQAGGIDGGTEIADPLNLNRNLNANLISNGPFCQPGVAPCPVPGAGAFLSFEALTNPLVAGRQYVLSFAQTTSANLVVLVPEPDSLALFGAMFIALGVGARVAKRRAS